MDLVEILGPQAFKNHFAAKRFRWSFLASHLEVCAMGEDRQFGLHYAGNCQNLFGSLIFRGPERGA